MPDSLLATAPWLALASGVLVSVLLAALGVRTWRAWRRARVTQDAATALIDVHMTTLDESIQRIDERMGTVADGGEELAEAIAELRANVAHLRWMLGRIPDERERLARELFELVLPTGSPKGSRDDG